MKKFKLVLGKQWKQLEPRPPFRAFNAADVQAAKSELEYCMKNGHSSGEMAAGDYPSVLDTWLLVIEDPGPQYVPGHEDWGEVSL